MGKTADLTVVQKTIIDTLHKEGKPQTFITKEAVHRVLYPSMLTESWVEGKSVEEKDAQPTEHVYIEGKYVMFIYYIYNKNYMNINRRNYM